MLCSLHFVGEGGPVLDWATRVKVAAGAARGIAYLHEDCNYLYLFSTQPANMFCPYVSVTQNKWP